MLRVIECAVALWAVYSFGLSAIVDTEMGTSLSEKPIVQTGEPLNGVQTVFVLLASDEVLRFKWKGDTPEIVETWHRSGLLKPFRQTIPELVRFGDGRSVLVVDYIPSADVNFMQRNVDYLGDVSTKLASEIPCDPQYSEVSPDGTIYVWCGVGEAIRYRGRFFSDAPSPEWKGWEPPDELKVANCFIFAANDSIVFQKHFSSEIFVAHVKHSRTADVLYAPLVRHRNYVALPERFDSRIVGVTDDNEAVVAVMPADSLQVTELHVIDIDSKKVVRVVELSHALPLGWTTRTVIVNSVLWFVPEAFPGLCYADISNTQIIGCIGLDDAVVAVW